MNKAKRIFVVFGLLSATVIMTGCSGINYTHGVSPATFLLPGLVNTEGPKPDTEDVRQDSAYVLVNQNL